MLTPLSVHDRIPSFLLTFSRNCFNCIELLKLKMNKISGFVLVTLASIVVLTDTTVAQFPGDGGKVKDRNF